MLKNNKLKLIISSVIILCPIIAGLIMWDILPEKIATHWNMNGDANGWSTRFFAVFLLPLFMLAVHWLCLLATAADRKNKNQNNKIYSLVFWICPVASVYSSAVIYSTALGYELSQPKVTLLLLGILFVIIGNYLPKCRQNHTIGIKVKWTLENEDNWDATHRFSGKIWVCGGLIIMLCFFLPDFLLLYILLPVLLLLAVIPFVYSYIYYRKN